MHSARTRFLRILHFIAAAWLIASIQPLQAAPPQTISYQGYLASSGGVPQTGVVEMTFRIYTVASGGSALWTETNPSVTVTNGVFNTVLGSVTPITLAFDVPYFLGVTVSPDGEMSPRLALTAAPYAFRSNLANTVAANFDSGWFYVTDLSGDITVPHSLGTVPSHFLLQQCGALSPTPAPQPSVGSPSFGSCTTRVSVAVQSGYGDGGTFVNPHRITMSGTDFLVPMVPGFWAWAYLTIAGGWACPGDFDGNCFTGYYRILAWR